MLEQLSPWEYQTVRRVLGHGSGFDSPGMREVRRVSPPFWDAFVAALAEYGLDPVEVYRRGGEFESLFQLGPALTGWGEQMSPRRVRHCRAVPRFIGAQRVCT